MSFLNIYLYLVRIALIILSVRHLCKREYMPLASSVIAFAMTYLLWIFERISVYPDAFGSFLYLSLLPMTMYLGNVLKFYDKYFWWDMLIHFLSGIVFVSFAVALSAKAGDLKKFHLLFFCFTYSLSHHVLWEVLEYLSDCFFHTDHQRWQKRHVTNNHVSESAIQPAGLVDTMNDTLICIAGTIVSCAVWWFIL